MRPSADVNTTPPVLPNKRWVSTHNAIDEWDGDRPCESWIVVFADGRWIEKILLVDFDFRSSFAVHRCVFFSRLFDHGRHHLLVAFSAFHDGTPFAQFL